MARGRDKAVVLGLAAVIILIVGVGFAFRSSGRKGAPAEEVGAASAPLPDPGNVGAAPALPPPPRKTGAPAPGAPAEPQPEPDPVPEPEPEEPNPAPVGILAGTVRSADGTAVEGAGLTLRFDTNRNTGELPEYKLRSFSTKSDAYGEFRFENVPPGQWYMEVSHADFAPRRISGIELTDLAGQEELAVVLVGGGLDRGVQPLPGVTEGVGAVEGTVANAQDIPAGEVKVVLSGHDGGGRASTAPDAEGNYRFDKVLPGSYTVRLEKLATRPSPKGGGTESYWERAVTQFVDVEPGETVRVDFAGSATLTGVVLDGRGGALARVIVRIAPLDERGGHRGGHYRPIQTRTDANGRFTIENLDEGPHRVEIQSLAKGDSFAVRLEDIRLTGRDQEVTLRLESTEITGRITAEGTGRPPENRPQISLYHLKMRENRDGDMEETIAGSAGMAFMDKEGRYAFRSIVPGRYRICVYLREHRTGQRDIELLSGRSLTGVDFDMRKLRPGKLLVRVKDVDGTPIEGVSFTYSGDGKIWTTLHCDQREPGTYVNKQLETGTWQIGLSRAGLRPTTVEVKMKEGRTTEVEVVLEAP